MRKIFTLFLIALIPTALFAQTDVTSDLIANADFESTPIGWQYYANQGAAATLNAVDATGVDGTKAGVINVTTAAALHNVVMKTTGAVNENVDWSGREITLTVKAKSTNSSRFKLRFLSKPSGGGSNILQASPFFNTTDSYQEFTMTYTIPDNIDDVEINVMCGETPDTYYFDDFKATTPTPLSVDDKDLTQDFALYPNPATDVVNIETNSQISNVDVFDLVGRKQAVVLSNGAVNISSLNSGLYILSINFENGASLHKKITIL